MKVALRLGYAPNALAQGLISGRTNLVALLITSQTNCNYPEVLAELTQQLSKRNIQVLLFTLSSEQDVDAVMERLWRYRIDGAISAAHLSDDQIRLFRQHHVPLILYNRVADSVPTTSVCCDSMTGVQEIVTHLIQAGHRRFGIIAGPKDSYVGEDRRRVAVQRLAEEGIMDVPVVRGDFSYESGVEGLAELMELDADIEAVICVNDMMAIGAIDAGRNDFGLSIPGQLSVVGFDGSSPASWGSYRVTSIRQPVRRMAEATVAMLVDRIDDPDRPMERRLLAGEFVRGNSARLPQG